MSLPPCLRASVVGFHFFLAAIACHAQSPLSVPYQKSVQFSVPGATAAYSLDSSVAEAGASNGLVEVHGRGPGSTSIVIVTSAGVQTLPVVVPQPPPSYPPGFVASEVQGAAGERGAYEVRYNSDPSQLTNSIEMMRTQGESFDRLQITNATLFSSNSSQSQVGFPLASYEIKRAHRDLTFIDQVVTNSPFSVDGATVRGFHWQEGAWRFHGGFTSVATFQSAFLSTDPEYVAGLSRDFTLNKSNVLEANFYYFQNPARQLSVASNGGVGSVVHRWKKGDRASLLTELGVSHWGLGFATRGGYDDKKSHIHGGFRIMPQRFASLALNNQHGTFADLSAQREFTRRLSLNADLNQSNFNLLSLRQNTFSQDAGLNFRLTDHFSVSGGEAYSRFQSLTPVSAAVETLNLPVGVDFPLRHFGAGFQYQRTHNFNGGGGNDYAANARGSIKQFQLNAFYRHDVQTPTLAAIFAQAPGLQDLLDRAGIVVTTPDELAQLLRNASLLATLGFTGPLTVNLAPARDDTGASASWIGKGASRPQVALSYFNSRTQLLSGSFTFATTSLSYSQHVSSMNDVFGSVALIRTVNGGIADTRPVVSISFRRRFSTVPSLLLPGRRGQISGHVFLDDLSIGQYHGQQTGVGGVEVRLDGTRTTHTDNRGYYSFKRVPWGPHKVEVRFDSSEPFFYTSDSPAAAEINSTVDFGINFSKGQVFGFLLNDAGKGVAGIAVELQGRGAPRTVQTGADGKFSFQGLQPGAYNVSTQAASYPPGYSLQDLDSVLAKVTVEAGKPAQAELHVKAIRTISGRVLVYDKTLLQNVPLKDVAVRLKELSLETRTGPTGAYIFRNLPAGIYTVVVTWQDKETTRTVVVPPEPANIRDIDITVP